ncbi:probable ATP-dependent RNA helicase DHR1 [Trichomonascus vanleenenianus]|uniref:ATP-dependent RNA helicase ECM16 n=1 Tax=Trichomonascus vanleenenianus TaxID=2268995 RepID=UPI003ECA1641
MGKYRERFNAKARAGTVAKQDELKRERTHRYFKDQANEDGTGYSSNTVAPSKPDSNAEIMLPMNMDQKLERKRKLEAEVKRNAPMSSKKRKRIDKYIDKQLKKEEKVELLKKLEKSKIDTSMLKSVKTLGVGQVTKREKFEEALALEKAGLGTQETRAILYEERKVKDWSEYAQDVEDLLNKPSSEPVEPLKPRQPDEVAIEEAGSDEEVKTSSFIDFRPKAPIGTGFGFADLKTVSKTVQKTKYSWRKRVEAENLRRKKIAVSLSDSEDESESEESVSEEASEGEQASDGEEVSEEEWNGFSDGNESSKSEPENSSSSEEEEDEDEEEEEEEEEEPATDDKSRGQAFKEWAKRLTQPETTPIQMPEYKGTYIPLDRPEDQEELPAHLVVPEAKQTRISRFVNIDRPEEIQAARTELPVVMEEQRIMEAIHNNPCVVISSETGSGKTTQIPQFLFEAGYGSPDSDTPGMIGITQPRRVAAVSMASRVGQELGDHGSKVGYQIRFDAKVNESTAIKFMTDGVLLRELSNDFTLSKYSAIVIDEAHERNINTDILIGVLSRVMKLRTEMAEKGEARPLKLIIMSATLRVSDFTKNSQLFDTPPPVIHVKGRQHEVTVHFNRRTQFNYLDDVYDKAVKIHQRLPPGGILIFLTGQNEITSMVRRLRKAFPKAANKKDEDEIKLRISAKEAAAEIDDIELAIDDEDLVVDEENDDYVDDEEEEEGLELSLEEGQDANAPMHVLPLYSLLSTKEQMKIFQPPPEGHRLVVVATNVAETSLTIPGIKYVVDCGRSKERHYDDQTGVQSFKISWTSKASADQRAGRAGRTGPGHCYRIYSSAIYETEFEKFAKPEIMRMPIEGVILQMKYMGIHNIVNFPFPTPPPKLALSKGLKLLRYLSALDANDAITELGRLMSLFPLSPRYAKMLLIGDQHSCLSYIIAIVAGLTVGDPFIQQHELGIEDKQQDKNGSDEEEEEEEETVEQKEFKRKLRGEYYLAQSKFEQLDDKSDALKLLCAVCAYDWDKDHDSFAKKHFLRFKMMDEIYKLRQQIAYVVASNTSANSIDHTTKKLQSKLKPPTKIQVKAIKQIIAAGFVDQVAIRADKIEEIENRAKSRVITFPYISLFPAVDASAQDDEEKPIDPYVYVHPSSVLANGNTAPEYLIFKSMNLSEGRKIKRVRIKPLCDVTGAQLANIGKSSSLITYSKPLGPPYGPKNITPTKRECWVVPRIGAAIGSGGVGWDLPVVKVIQEREGVHWVVK